MCTLATRGPVRRVGGEAAPAGTMRAAVADALPSGGRVGIADGCFAARLAAIEQTVPPGRTRAFLAPLPVTVLSPPDLVAILQRPGVYRLGDLAALPARDGRQRHPDHRRRGPHPPPTSRHGPAGRL